MTAPALILTPTGAAACRAAGLPAPLRARDFEVRPVSLAAARPLVEAWHYARGVGQSTAAFTLHARACGTPVAVAVFNPPSLGAAKFMAQGVTTHQGVLNLSRLSFHPDAPRNAGSFLLARAIAALPDRWAVISTYADTAQGVVGTVYQAVAAEYRGPSAARPVWTRQGVQVSTQRGARTLTHDDMLAEGCTLAARAVMHRYRLVRGQIETRRNPHTYPKAMPRLLSPA